MQCKAQTAAVAGHWLRFATRQSAKIRIFLQREEWFGASLVFSLSLFAAALVNDALSLAFLAQPFSLEKPR